MISLPTLQTLFTVCFSYLTQSKHSVNAGDGEKDDFSNGSNDGDGEDDVDVMIMNIKGFSMFLS